MLPHAAQGATACIANVTCLLLLLSIVQAVRELATSTGVCSLYRACRQYRCDFYKGFQSLQKLAIYSRACNLYTNLQSLQELTTSVGAYNFCRTFYLYRNLQYALEIATCARISNLLHSRAFECHKHHRLNHKYAL